MDDHKKSGILRDNTIVALERKQEKEGNERPWFSGIQKRDAGQRLSKDYCLQQRVLLQKRRIKNDKRKKGPLGV